MKRLEECEEGFDRHVTNSSDRDSSFRQTTRRRLWSNILDGPESGFVTRKRLIAFAEIALLVEQRERVVDFCGRSLSLQPFHDVICRPATIN